MFCSPWAQALKGRKGLGHRAKVDYQIGFPKTILKELLRLVEFLLSSSVVGPLIENQENGKLRTLHKPFFDVLR